MSTTATAPLTNGQPVEGDGLTARKVRDISGYLEAARRRLGIQVKEIALTWGTSHVYASNVLSGKEPLPGWRIAQLDPALQVAIVQEWAEALGLLVGSRAAAIGALEAARYLLTLPERADRMATVTLDTETAPARRRA